MNQIAAAEKKTKKNPSRQTRAFFQEAATKKRDQILQKDCAFIVAAPADFFNPKKHNSHGKAKK